MNNCLQIYMQMNFKESPAFKLYCAPQKYETDRVMKTNNGRWTITKRVQNKTFTSGFIFYCHF